MYRSYKFPFSFEKEGISISVETKGDIHEYKRKYQDEAVEMFFIAANGKILVNPIEPLNVPKKITSYLLIEFEKTITIAPEGKINIYIKFPVEIGVFVSDNNVFEVLDILTLVRKKFTLYGDPSNGMICKYWKSEVYDSMPPVNPLFEGVMELEIINDTKHWVEVTKSIFNAYGMKIYYNHDLVSLKASMRIMAHIIAETDFIDSPIRSGMKKAIELYTVKRIYVNSTKCIMEAGI